MKTTLSTKGLAEQLERIIQAGQDIDAAVDDALQAGGEVLVDGMKRRAPVLTGNLAGTIHATEPRQDGNFHTIEVGLPSDVDAETARYGNAQEFGTANMPAHPYLRPTIDEDGRKAQRAMKNTLVDRGAL